MKLKVLETILIALILTPVLTACGGTPTPVDEEEEGVRIISDFIPVATLEELVTKAHVIIIGEFADKGEMVLFPGGATGYSILQYYFINTERYLKGNGAKTIRVMQNEGIIMVRQPKVPSQALIEKVRARSGAVPFQSGMKYLLFLFERKDDNGGNYFSAGFSPWRWVVKNGVVQKDNPNPGFAMSSREVSLAKPIDEVIKDIEDIVKRTTP
jgi:hypothetical protein